MSAFNYASFGPPLSDGEEEPTVEVPKTIRQPTGYLRVPMKTSINKCQGHKCKLCTKNGRTNGKHVPGG
jgi:hypothetical protein